MLVTPHQRIRGNTNLLTPGKRYKAKPCAMNPRYLMLEAAHGPEMVKADLVRDVSDQSERVGDDGYEQAVAKCLTGLGIQYQTDYEGKSPANLDFYLPDYDVHIEVKSLHADRLMKQMARAENVIVLQGPAAVQFFVDRMGNGS